MSGAGHFIVLPPSRLNLTKPPYQWLNGLGVADAPPLPDELATLLSKKRGRFDTALESACEAIRAARPGTAHDTIVSATWELAAHILAQKLEYDAVLQAVVEAAEERGHDRLEAEDALNGALDKRRASASTGAGRPVSSPAIKPVEPWPEPVGDLAAVLDAADACFKTYTVMPEECRTALIGFAAATHFVSIARFGLRLNLWSPVPECGKTNALVVLKGLVAKPHLTSSLTRSAFVRTIDAAGDEPPTMLWDECDASVVQADWPFAHALNSGFDRLTARYDMTEGTNGGTRQARSFKTFSFLVLAGIGRLAGRGPVAALASRCLSVGMTRPLPDVLAALSELDMTADSPSCDSGRQIARWAADNIIRVRDTIPSYSSGLRVGRPRNIWRLPLQLGKLAGKRWHERMQAGAVKISKRDLDMEDLTLQLLADACTIDDVAAYLARPERDEKAAVTVARLHQELIRLVGSPWQSFGERGFPVTVNRMSRMLAEFNIRSEVSWITGRAERVYRLESFVEPWRVYVCK